MNRREVIKSISLGVAVTQLPIFSNSIAFAGISQAKNSLIKANPLKPGDTIGVIAPGSAVSSPDDFILVKELTDYLGLKVKFAKNVAKGSGYKTRTISERTDDIHEMFADSSIAGIICIRGGYGAAQLLDKLDYSLIKNNPKIFVGYSDITSLHLAIHKMTGLVTFHGPMLLANFPQLTIDNFKRTLFSAEPVGIIKNPENRTPVRSAYPVRTIKSGIAKGGLIGGNLTLVCSLMGTKYEIDTKGKILFIEDVDEEPYKIDRMLTHLKTAGKLQESAAIVFGNCSDCSSASKLKPSLSWDHSLAEVIDNAFVDLKQPSFYGLTFGHSSTQFTIPYGIEAELNADDCSLNLIESHLK